MKPIGENIIPEPRDEYIHIKSGNRYMVINLGLMKDPNDGKWIKSVSYVNWKAETFTRSLQSFQKSFADADGIVEI